jgi:hypothetical protein
LETNDLSQSVLAAISPVFGMQTANDSLVSQDYETASDDKSLDICPLAAISLVFGMQTANDSLVSQDDETASDDKSLDICPTLVNFIATLEQ